ncbi:MAG: hypothetical protein V4664_01240 [Patescibacteria group bacterium]
MKSLKEFLPTIENDNDITESRRVEIDLAALFPVGEHGLYMYYGRIGMGKTYAMTADVLEALRHGKVVYTNYPIFYEGYNETEHWPYLLLGFLGIKRTFYNFPKENLRQIVVDENFHETLSKLTDCIVALDEGYVVFDSYQMAKISMTERQNVLHTRHFDRSIWITAQRPTNVHVVMRSQVNVFYRVRKMISWPVVVFQRCEYDLASNETVDEEEPFSMKLYIGRKRIFEAYNTKYLRYGAKSSQSVLVEALRLGWWRATRALFGFRRKG